jgi:hypothetical protein
MAGHWPVYGSRSGTVSRAAAREGVGGGGSDDNTPDHTFNRHLG